ncbi:hypothetical protein HLB23_20785 [Nocardia uniformis]|uniref:Uncharacterized protein n=1 Tax=Nocardia uniformis TaxID=53432 RepID=A0A849C7H0_9NOCA|nr:hypothetical protein [Nocardia uniformis]NNH72265.1 hypothetical protein [Nocardia uniformis]
MQARELAIERVEAVQAQPDRRLRVAAECYPARLAAYGRAELTFLRWELNRGVLDPRSGSRWWRAINDRLLTDKIEARLVRADGGRASTPSARSWGEFLDAPTPLSWYRAHNHSVVSGYLDSEGLVDAELAVERFMINVTLARVLFTHALIERPGLALGRFARLGPRIADPRSHSVSLFLDLRDVFPPRYPLHGLSIQQVLENEGRLARAIDDGLLLPKVDRLYAFAAASFAEPRLTSLVSNGRFCYGRPDVDRAVREVTALARLFRVATRTRRG